MRVIMDTQKQISDAINFRFACKEFDTKRKISDRDFNLILEAGRLSPSSFGMEPWKFLVVQKPAVREKIREFSWGAQKQLATASHYVILLARTATDVRFDSAYIRETMGDLQKSPPDVIEKRILRFKHFQEDHYKLSSDRALADWARMQVYIVLGYMLMTASLLQIDSCPIEGFNREKVESILAEDNLLNRNHFDIACMVAFGYRVNEPIEPKTRRSLEQITEWVK